MSISERAFRRLGAVAQAMGRSFLDPRVVPVQSRRARHLRRSESSVLSRSTRLSERRRAGRP